MKIGVLPKTTPKSLILLTLIKKPTAQAIGFYFLLVN